MFDCVQTVERRTEEISGSYKKLPSPDRSRTLFLLEIERLWSWRGLGRERENKRQLRRQELLARGYPNVIAKARIYQAALAEPGATYRTLARRFGVTREEICQYMVVLNRLPPEMIAVVEHERDPLRLRQFSLRRLLVIARGRTAVS